MFAVLIIIVKVEIKPELLFFTLACIIPISFIFSRQLETNNTNLERVLCY